MLSVLKINILYIAFLTFDDLFGDERETFEHSFAFKVIKHSQDLGHRQILDAQSYRSAKELATDYQKTRTMLYNRLQETGYGSWDLMKKPPELSHFN